MSDYQEYTSRMEKTVSVLEKQYATVRAGRANPAVLDQIRVEYYGAPTPIQQIASISATDSRTLVIQPWDPSALKIIEKAIQASDLGINPQNDGRVIRLGFPQLTEDRRKELIKQCAGYSEEAKVAVRNIRREAMERYKADKKKSIITEDDLKDVEKDLSKITEDYTKKIDAVMKRKEKELSEI